MDNKPINISDITVEEFKALIRDTVREYLY